MIEFIKNVNDFVSFFFFQRVFENYTFLAFTIFLAGFWTFTYKKIPETKNKTFEEISALFRRDEDTMNVNGVNMLQETLQPAELMYVEKQAPLAQCKYYISLIHHSNHGISFLISKWNIFFSLVQYMQNNIQIQICVLKIAHTIGKSIGEVRLVLLIIKRNNTSSATKSLQINKSFLNNASITSPFLFSSQIISFLS